MEFYIAEEGIDVYKRQGRGTTKGTVWDIKDNHNYYYIEKKKIYRI